MEPVSDSLDPGLPEDLPNYEIVYPDGEEDNVKVEPHLYPFSFAWPSDNPFCSATMISDQVAITSAHCIKYADMDAVNPLLDGSPISVSLTNSV